MPFIVVKKKTGVISGKTRYKVSKLPRPHDTQESALAEAIRLADKEKTQFAIFSEVGTVCPPIDVKPAE